MKFYLALLCLLFSSVCFAQKYPGWGEDASRGYKRPQRTTLTTKPSNQYVIPEKTLSSVLFPINQIEEASQVLHSLQIVPENIEIGFTGNQENAYIYFNCINASQTWANETGRAIEFKDWLAQKLAGQINIIGTNNCNTIKYDSQLKQEFVKTLSLGGVSVTKLTPIYLAKVLTQGKYIEEAISFLNRIGITGYNYQITYLPNDKDLVTITYNCKYTAWNLYVKATEGTVEYKDWLLSTLSASDKEKGYSFTNCEETSVNAHRWAF